jgi:hypothetical protein
MALVDKINDPRRVCFYCGVNLVVYVCTKQTPKAPDNGYTRDHLAKGIVNTTVPACFKCNNHRGRLTLDEWRLVCALKAGMVKVPQYTFPGERNGTLREE